MTTPLRLRPATLPTLLPGFHRCPAALARTVGIATIALIGLAGCDSAEQNELAQIADATQQSAALTQATAADSLAAAKDVAADTVAHPVGGSTDAAAQAIIHQKSYNQLSSLASRVIEQKGTEPAGDGGYTLTKAKGTYICRRCNAMLYDSSSKFASHCGWPSFDSQFEGAVAWELDADGQRVEILCNHCDGHLGHVFQGEQLTESNTRHCVNSISMILIRSGAEIPAKITVAP